MPSPKFDSTYPWFSRVISRREKSLAVAGYVIAVVASCWFYQTVKIANNNSINLLLSMSILLVAGVAILGLMWLLQILRSPTPASLAATKREMLPFVLGKPFAIQHQFRPGFSIYGAGTLKFTGTKLSITGKTGPRISYIAVVILICTVIPLLFIGVGLGLLLAGYVAYRLGSKPYQRTVPFSDIASFKVSGVVVELVVAGSKPDDMNFRVSLADGERLYRELYARCPQSIAKWQPEMVRVTNEQPSVGW